MELPSTGISAEHVRFRRRVEGLPQPLHLFVYLTGGHHYHFGEFSQGDEPLGAGLERRAHSCIRLFPEGGSILDVGCGLGGASQLMSERGHRVLGIDPSAGAIEFARATLPPSEGLRFENTSLGIKDHCGDHPFDGLLFIEVLQFFPAPIELLQHCHEITRPGSIFVFSDVFSCVDRPFESVPYHRLDTFEAAARQIGLESVVEGRAIAHPVRTLSRLLKALRARRGELIAYFAARGPRIEGEIDELAEQCELLLTAFRAGDLTHRTLAFRSLG